jgi:excisionase family DNA binding protein
MTPPDYSTWLTKQQAAEAIGVTTKSIERFVQEGKIQQARWRRPTGGPELAVYHPDDVARIAQARQPGPLPPFLVPGGAPASTNGNGHGGLTPITPITPSPFSNVEEARRAFVVGLSEFAGLLKTVSQTSETSTLWVTVPEAAAILGFPQADVRRLIHDGELNCRRTGRGGIRIRRTDLGAL